MKSLVRRRVGTRSAAPGQKSVVPPEAVGLIRPTEITNVTLDTVLVSHEAVNPTRAESERAHTTSPQNA